MLPRPAMSACTPDMRRVSSSLSKPRRAGRAPRVAASGRVPGSLLRLASGHPVGGAASGGAERARLSVRIDSATQALLAPWVDPSTLERIQADVAGGLSIEADSLALARIDGEVQLDRAQAVLSGIELKQAHPTRISIVRGMARASDWEWEGPGSHVVVNGEAQVGRRPDIDFAASGTSTLPPSVRFCPGFRRRDGGASIFGRTARPAGLQLDGQIVLSNAGFRMSGPDLVAAGFAGSLVMKGNRDLDRGYRRHVERRHRVPCWRDDGLAATRRLALGRGSRDCVRLRRTPHRDRRGSELDQGRFTTGAFRTRDDSERRLSRAVVPDRHPAGAEDAGSCHRGILRSRR